MTSIFGRIFSLRPIPAPPVQASAAEDRYAVAVRESDDLLQKMRAAYASTDPVRQAMADIWAQRHNVPYVTSVYETVQEVNVAKAASSK